MVLKEIQGAIGLTGLIGETGPQGVKETKVIQGNRLSKVFKVVEMMYQWC
jgi:hypothetical protein